MFSGLPYALFPAPHVNLFYVNVITRPANKIRMEEGKIFLLNNPKVEKVEAQGFLKLVLEVLECHFSNTLPVIASLKASPDSWKGTRFCISMEGMKDGKIEENIVGVIYI